MPQPGNIDNTCQLTVTDVSPETIRRKEEAYYDVETLENIFTISYYSTMTTSRKRVFTTVIGNSFMIGLTQNLSANEIGFAVSIIK